MRNLYALAMYLGTPLVLMHLAWRGLRDRAYLGRWRERFGVFPRPAKPGGIVVHAASVGEVNAAAPLVRALLRRFPQDSVTVSTFTPTGSARVTSLFGGRVFHAYAPLDLPGAVRRFFDRLEPRLLVVLETEIWPNLYAAADVRNIPLLMANARISERSVKGYGRWRSLFEDALRRVSHATAQSAIDAERLISLGVDPERVEVAGNLKFDVDVPAGLLEQGQALRARWGADRPVVLAGSTHGEDEETILGAFRLLLDRRPDVLLIMVPRHPERFGRAAQAILDAGFRVELRSEREACSPAAQCFVIDTMGELLRYYACCDVAVVGGSFSPIGGHNVLEPAALARPVIVGPHTINLGDIIARMLEDGAALQLETAAELADHLSGLLDDAELRGRMGQAGLALVNNGRGALDRNLAVIDRLLETP